MGKENGDGGGKLIKFGHALNTESFNKHIEKFIRNINMEGFDILSDVDPVLIKTKRRFDQSGFKGLLLNRVALDSSFTLAANPELKRFGIDADFAREKEEKNLKPAFVIDLEVLDE